MNFLRTTVINSENCIHYLITWVFNLIHTTIDCFSAIIEQWLVEEATEEQVKQDNNRKNKIGF